MTVSRRVSPAARGEAAPLRYASSWLRLPPPTIGRLAGCVLLASLWGCARPEARSLAWPEGLDWAVVVREGATGPHVQGVVAFEDGHSLRDELHFELDEASYAELALYGWSKDEFLARAPELDPEGWWAVEVGTLGHGCAEGRVSSAEGWSIPLSRLRPSSFTLDAEGRAFVPSAPSPVVLTTLAAIIPAEHVACGVPASSAVERVSDAVFPPGTRLAGHELTVPRASGLVFHQILRVDEERWLARSYEALFLFARGRSYEDTPAERVLAAELPPPPGVASRVRGWAWSGMSAASRDSAGAVTRVFASANYGHESEPSEEGGGVFELDLGPQGFLRPVRTSTVYARRPGPGPLAADLGGGYVVVGTEGLLLSRASDGSPVRRGQLEPRAWYRRVLGTPHSVLRHAAGSENGHLVVGDFHQELNPRGGEVLGEVSTAVTGLSYVAAPSPRILAGTFGSGLWQVAEDRQLSPFRFWTDAPAGCITQEDACGLRSVDRANLASGDGAMVFASAGRCGDVLAIDPVRRCARSIGLSVERLSAMDLAFGVLTVTGDLGDVFEVRWAE